MVGSRVLGRADLVASSWGSKGSNRITQDPHIVSFCEVLSYIYGHVGERITMAYFLHTREMPTLRFGRSAAT